MIQKGDILQILPEWLDAGESPDTLYIAVSDEEKGLLDISPVEWKFRIVPINTVETRMVKKASEAA